MVMFVAVATCGFTACGGDGDDAGEAGVLIDSWAAEFDEDGEYISIAYTFHTNGTGTCSTKMIVGTTTYQDNEAFEYTYADGVLFLNYEDYAERWYVTITGNTLMLNDGESLLTLKRK